MACSEINNVSVADGPADNRNQRRGSGRPADDISSAKAGAGMWLA